MTMLLETLRLLAPEFQETDDNLIINWIHLSIPLVSKTRFGSLYMQAVALLTAHRMKLAGLGDNPFGTAMASAGVSSYSEGGTSISYNTNQQTNLQTDAEFALTSYGVQYLSLRRSCIVAILSSGE